MRDVTDLSDAPEDWDKVEIEVIKSMVAQGETTIKAQMQLALDADKRALAFGASATTFSTAILAAVLVAYNKEVGALYLAPGIGASLVSFVAACIFFYSARPVNIVLPGNDPRNWWSNATKSHKRLLGSEALNYQEVIDDNAHFLEQNSIYVRVGMAVFAANPVVALILFLILLPF